MIRRLSALRMVVAVAVALPVGAQDAVAELLARLPDEALAVVVADDLQRSVTACEAALGTVPAGLPPAAVAKLGAGLVFVRTILGGSLGDTARVLAGGGVALGVIPAADGLHFVAATRPADPEAALSWCERARGRLHAATDRGLLLLSDSAAVVQSVRTSTAVGRWGAFDFRAPAGPSVARGAIDLAALRSLRAGGGLVPRLPSAGRIALLPIVEALAHAQWLRFSVQADAGFSVAVTADASVVGGDKGALLAAGTAARDMIPLADDGIALLSLDRCLRRLFEQLERHLPPADVLAAQGFLSIADALFGARSSFVDDLLGGLEEPFVLHVMPAAVAADDGADRSPLQLPGFALVARIATPNVEAVVLRLASVFVTIANAERAQRGQGVFQLRRVTDETGTGFVAEPPPWHGPGAPPVDRQLSPTLWCGRGHVVLASTAAAARRIVDRAGAAVAVRGDLLLLRGPALASALAANRMLLELARMLDEGEDGPAAAQFFTVAEVLVGALQRVDVRCEVTADSTRLELRLERR